MGADPADPLHEGKDPDKVALFGGLLDSPVVIRKVKFEADNFFTFDNNLEIHRFLEGGMMRADGDNNLGHFQVLSTFMPP